MNHDINANGALPSSPIRLSGYAISTMAIDGPPGFALELRVQSGEPVRLQQVDGANEPVGAALTVREGETKVVRERSTVSLLGVTDSYVTISRHDDDATGRTDGRPTRAWQREPEAA